MSTLNRLIKSGYQRAKTLTKTYAKTFYFSSIFLPPQKRYAAFSVYAACRISDNAVDDLSESAAYQLDKVRKKIDAVYNNTRLNDCVLLAFKETVNKYGIPRQYFDDLIDGMYMDLNKNRYQNFDQLYSYCYRVAGVVGLMMSKIFGYTNPQVPEYAVNLGIAMQLTNIARDIKEDFQRGRIYLPSEDMARFKVSESHIANEQLDSNFTELLRFQIWRARNYYDNSSNGIKMISDLRSRLTVTAMKEIYSAILNSIENNNYDVFSKRAYVPNRKKFMLTLKFLIEGKYL
ncbi:MAG: phytoene/squalene synthase family protein [Candidatus Omnitrophota bacterium]|nr:MAG: phytoene/squalene synthase family protein [Candidatus Omnitrophota bacterium]